MKVLFWVSPLTEMNWPFQKSWWLRDSVPHISAALAAGEPIEEQFVCISADLLRGFPELAEKLSGRVVALTQMELTDGYRLNALKARRHFQATGEMSPYYDHLDRLVAAKLGADFVPDVIVSFDDSPFLRRRYPRAAHLTFEYSVFSRAPYPSLYCFDPVSGGNGFRFTYAQHADVLNAVCASQEDIEALSALRDEVSRALTANRAISDYFAALRKRFRRMVLLPLGYEHFFNTLVQERYASQFDLVQHTLETVGPETCVVVTQHPTIHAIRSERLEELKKLYPNLAYEAWYGTVPSFSQVAVAYCDVCLTGSSSVAYQAAFLGKYVVLPDGFCPGLADAARLEEYDALWGRPPKDRASFFAWVLRHAAVDLADAGAYFKRALPVFRALRGKALDEKLRLWATVECGGPLSARVADWIAHVVRPFAATLRELELKAKAVVVVPVYKTTPSRAERLSLEQCRRVLSGHDIVLVAPEGLDLAAYVPADGSRLREERFASAFFEGIAGYNQLMTDASFYRRFADYDYMLVHQLDAWVFADELDAWCAKGFDYIGAPWFEKFLSHEQGAEPWLCGNGGFSLRRIATFIAATADGTARRVMAEKNIWEDGAFAYGLTGTPHAMRLPSVEEGLGFSFEHSPDYLYARNGRRLPFGCHAWEHCQFLSFWSAFIPHQLERPLGGTLSILTEVGDDLEGLKRTADSVLTQNWRAFEWILSDQGATSDVRHYIASTLKPYIAYFGKSRSGGLSRATGKYVVSLDAGDTFCDQTILSQVFAAPRDADVVYGEWVEPAREGVFYDHSVPHARQATFFKRSCLGWGGFRRACGHFAYWAKWRELERRNARFEYVRCWIASIRGESPLTERARAERARQLAACEEPDFWERTRMRMGKQANGS